MSNLIHPILLCGGSGTRLWPLSRNSYPKQFVKLLGEVRDTYGCSIITDVHEVSHCAPAAKVVDVF